MDIHNRVDKLQHLHRRISRYDRLTLEGEWALADRTQVGGEEDRLSTTGCQQRHKVFISYSTTDLSTAKGVLEHIESAGLSTFFAPRDIHGGSNFAVEIVKAISSCDVVVVLLSRSSIDSPHVRREVSLAVDERRDLLPLVLPETPYPSGFSTDWMYWLSAVQVMPYDSPQSTLEQIRSLLQNTRRSSVLIGAHRTETVSTRPLRRRLGDRKIPSSLLRAERGLPNLIGREGEMARLVQWCLRDDEFDARIITGSAGQGKTRMARELMQTLSARGWDTKMVAATTRGINEILRLHFKPTLFVIDYAEARGEQIVDMLHGLLEHGLSDKVRLLLLARSAGDWWRSLMASDADVTDLVADVTIQPLKQLALDRNFVNEIYSSAYKQFSTELQCEPRPIVIAPYKSYNSVLDVLEDALTTALGGGTKAQSGTDRLLGHEIRYLTASARADGINEVDDIDLNRIAAGLTLYGAANENDATVIVAECNPDLSVAMRRKIARLFRRLYPGSNLYIDGLRPDALAEDLIANLLKDDGRLPGDPMGLCAHSRTVEQKHRGLTILARGAIKHNTMAAELNKAIREANINLLILAVEVATQVEKADQLSALIARATINGPASTMANLLSEIPDETVALAPLAAQLSRQALAQLPKPDRLSNEDVKIAMACSNRFSDAGWGTEAAEAAYVAVDRLKFFRPADRNDRMLGRALTNLSNRLWEIGRVTESVKPAENATEVLVATTSTREEIAAALNNLAFRLEETNNNDSAMIQALEAERLCRSVSTDDDADVEKTLGSVLNNICSIALAAGQYNRALEYGNACVDLRRSQALQNRDKYLPYLARTLANAAPAAEICGKTDDADRFIFEARSLHVLTSERAPIFQFERAESATIHALLLLARENWDEAWRVASEARTILTSIEVDLGQLAFRLSNTIDQTLKRANDKQSVDLSQLAEHKYAQLMLPQLLEYRDL